MSEYYVIIPLNQTKGQLMSECIVCSEETTQFLTDDGGYYYPVCGECY